MWYGEKNMKFEGEVTCFLKEIKILKIRFPRPNKQTNKQINNKKNL